MTQYTTQQYLEDSQALDATFTKLSSGQNLFVHSILSGYRFKLRLFLSLGVPLKFDSPDGIIEFKSQLGPILDDEQVEIAKQWILDSIAFVENIKTLGPTFQAERVLKSTTNNVKLDPLTYCQNWDFINTFKDEVSKRTAFNFINSVLYRGEKLFMWSEEDTVTLIAFRNCSDEAQNIIEKAAEK